MSAVGIEVIGAGFALLAPVYALLFQIQHKLGRFETEISVVKEQVSENEDMIQS